MNISRTYVGAKYFRYDNKNNIEVIRVVNDKNPSSFKCKVEGSSRRISLPPDELKEKYTRLRPDGVIYFNIVHVGEILDVMILMYRNKDIQEKKNTPYIVCRQNITDVFANTINPNYDNLIVGLAVSEESLPEKLPMETVLSCDGMEKSIGVCVYMDDTLQDILSMIKTKDFDTVLYNLFVEHIRYKYKDNQKEYLSKKNVDGYSKTLQGLLEDNEFMYEFCHGYGIYPVTFEVTKDEINNGKLRLYNRLAMSNILMKNIVDTVVVSFDKDIELDKIEKDYFLLRDIKNKMYIVLYTYNGNMKIPVDEIESRENIKKMANIPGYCNIPDITNILQFNTSKYQ